MRKLVSKTSVLWLMLPLLPLGLSFHLLAQDALTFLTWWLGLWLSGFVVWPVAAAVFPVADRGYLMSKPLGLILLTLPLWLMSYAFDLPLSRLNTLLMLLFWLLIGYAWRPLRRGLFRSLTRQPPLRCLAMGETLFTTTLLFWTFARGLKPELDSLEKFMNIGFMNSLWRTESLPAADMWYAGHSINYYYFGHYLFTFFSRLTGIRPEISYNLALATTFALTFCGAYSLVSHGLQRARQNGRNLVAAAPAAGGLLAAVLTGIGGNSHAFFYYDQAFGYRFMLFLQRHGWVASDPDRSFWFADPTRFIGYNPNTADKTIHEFPFYSFLVADLHAHVINLGFVLLFLVILLHFLAKPAAPTDKSADTESIGDDPAWHRQACLAMWRRTSATLSQPHMILIGVLLAVFMMCNFWDFAIYLGLTFLVLVARNYFSSRRLGSRNGLFIFLVQMVMLLPIFLFVSQPWLAVLLYGLAFGAGSYLTILSDDALGAAGSQISWLFFLSHAIALPFNHQFEPIAKEIAFSVDRSPIWQLSMLWSAHVLAGLTLCIAALIFLYRRYRLRRLPQTASERKLATLPGNSMTQAIFRLPAADLFFAITFVSGVLLLLVPEVVYVVDIYSGEFKRANTMFKFTYQAFLLLSVFWAYGLCHLLMHRQHGLSGRKNIGLKIVAVCLCLLCLIPLSYPAVATRQWLGPLQRDRYRGLDGLTPLVEKNSPQIEAPFSASLSSDIAAIFWLNENVRGQPVILEAFGESYTDYCRISAFTGLPTVMGWETHQWLWRTSQDTPNAYGSVVLPRQEDVRLLYTGEDPATRTKLLSDYEIRYIIVGNLERSRFSDPELAAGHTIKEDELLQLGTVVFRQDDLYIIKIEP